MRCKILPIHNGDDNDPTTTVEVKLHRHTIEIRGVSETDAFELEEILSRAKTIKVRSYYIENNRGYEKDVVKKRLR